MVHAQGETSTGRAAIYISAGSQNETGEFKNDDMPFAVGIMAQLPNSKMILGFDLGREGTMIDSTWGQHNDTSQATSYNLLVGANLYDDGLIKMDGALLVGMRESFSDCPDSYLGYQCYADTEPDTEYEGNYGAVITMSYRKVMFGLRGTGESAQVMLGLRF